MPDLFSQLQECKWRTVSFPTVSFSTSIQHDQAQHKWPDRDGAHVEATGRQPLVHRATIPFRNGVSPGKGETFGVLYPDAFRAFLIAFSDRTSGTLIHPELGPVTCKPQMASADWSANIRDGVNVTASWIESYDEDKQYAETLARPSPIAGVYIEALDLDSQLTQYTDPTGLVKPASVDPKAPTMTFTQAITKITGAFDQVSLVSKRAGGYIDAVLYRVNTLQAACYAAKDNATWPIVNSCERLKASLYGLKQTQLTQQKDILLYVVPKDQTLAAIAATLGASVKDLVTLNSSLANAPIVPRLTSVRYYAT